MHMTQQCCYYRQFKASDIVKGIASTDYKGILGSISFDSNGDPIKEPVFVQIKNGQYTTYKK